MAQPILLLRREFTVKTDAATAWRHLANVADWPSWARHIKRVDLTPPGPVGPDSAGAFHLAGGIRSTFRMTEFNQGRNWKWSGPFLWLRIDYDHLFESPNAEETKLIWTIHGQGFAVSILGRLFARIYNRNLNRAIPNLVQQMEAAAQAPDDFSS